MVNIKLNKSRLRNLDFSIPTQDRSFKMVSSGSTCEFCGRHFASKEAKERHKEVHIQQARNEGMEVRYVYDSLTGESVAKGFKSIYD